MSAAGKARLPRVRLSASTSVVHTRAGVLLRSDLGTFRLQGARVRSLVRAIVPLLDGSRGREAVASALGRYSRRSVLAFLDMLAQRGVLETVDERPKGRWRGQEEFVRKWTGAPDEPARRLRETRVLIVGLEPWGAVAASELAAGGVGTLHLLDDGAVTVDDLLSVRSWSDRDLGRGRGKALLEVLAEQAPWCRTTAGAPGLTGDRDLGLTDTRWDLVIGSVAKDEMLLLRALAHFAHQHRIPSLYGHLDGLSAVLGPVVVPGEGACWNCARLRLLATSDQPEVEHALQATLLEGRPVRRTRTYLAPAAPLLGHLLALEALKILSHYTPSGLRARLLIQNLITLETTVHAVIQMPWCDVCGGAGVATPQTPSGAGSRGGGAGVERQSFLKELENADDPNEFRKLLAGWVDDRTGIIKQLAVAAPEPDDPALPVGSVAALASYTEGTYTPREPEICSGRGLTATAAMLGAVGEAIERYSAARYRQVELHRSPLNSLEGDFLDPRRLCLYEPAQYDRPKFPFARFDPDRPITWTRGYWVDSGTPVWLPALLTYWGFEAPPEERFCQVTTSGLAAGASPEDAALRAILELVERDAFMISWLARRPGRRLLLDDTLGPDICGVIRQLQVRGVGVELFLLDAGIPIPAVVCLCLGDGERWPGATVTVAAHLSPRAASRKAIIDNRLAGPYIRRLVRSGERVIPRSPKQVRAPIDHALYYAPAQRVRAFDFLGNGDGPPIAVSELAEPKDISLAACVGKLIAGGVRVAIADVTSPDAAGSPFRVARALGPEIQPLDFGFGLRRLANPRLKAMLTTGLSPHPHPMT